MAMSMETAQFLARFKLQVKRALGQSVDLDRLTRDADYARQRLAEIEEAADEEALLVMVVQLRDLLRTSLAEPEAALVEAAAAPKTAETRSYLMGARTWR